MPGPRACAENGMYIPGALTRVLVWPRPGITLTLGVSQRSVRKNLEQYRGISENNEVVPMDGILGCLRT